MILELFLNDSWIMFYKRWAFNIAIMHLIEVFGINAGDYIDETSKVIFGLTKPQVLNIISNLI